MYTLMLCTSLVWAEEPTDTSTDDSSTTETPAEESKEPKAKKEKAPKEKPSKDKKEKAPKEKTKKSTTEKEPTLFTPHIIVGMETDAALSTTDLRANFLPQWHAGVQFPYWNERLGIVFQGVYRVSKMDAKASSDNLTDGSYTYAMKQQEGEVGLNLRIRIPEVPVVTPEIWLDPTVQMLQTTMDGKSGGAFPTAVEQLSRVGFHAALLGEYPLPVGQIVGGVHYTTYEFRGTMQGDTRNHAISPTVGYRYRFF